MKSSPIACEFCHPSFNGISIVLGEIGMGLSRPSFGRAVASIP